ncbi:hypothetical protein EV567_2553 [Streptomyces sp. BK239]|nr:hypothetical protein EV567_2553 [Streptomyces sp. BK239]
MNFRSEWGQSCRWGSAVEDRSSAFHVKQPKKPYTAARV